MVLFFALETPGPSVVNQWVRRQINLRGQSGNIILRGMVGSGYMGDIAVDDISVTQGPCGSEVSRARIPLPIEIKHLKFDLEMILT